MSETAAVVETPAVAVDWFKVNTKAILTELVDAVPWRHEWEVNRMQEAIQNIEADPVTILAKSEPRSPSQGQDNIQITALQASVAELTDLVHQLALGNAALQAKLAGTETVAPVAPTEPVAPVAPVAPTEPVAPIQGQ